MELIFLGRWQGAIATPPRLLGSERLSDWFWARGLAHNPSLSYELSAKVAR